MPALASRPRFRRIARFPRTVGRGPRLQGPEVGEGEWVLYSNGATQSLLSLLPVSSGWSNLNATGINDSGQIVGQGTFDGQQVAFLMTPDAAETPELATWRFGAYSAAAAAGRMAARKIGRKNSRSV